VLILDEPSNDLDFDSETALLQTLRQIAQKHTVVVVTHSVRVASQAQRIYHVRGDGGIDHGLPEQMLPKLFGVNLRGNAGGTTGAGSGTAAPQTLETA
jgi:ATP-binding cassette subfamily C protein LapB